ncbi:MAG: hypothetical protein EOR30_29825 [Mesorhizobium sp.]|nr:MAG: hypothetical protein EOR14_31720 [Mesorhizobium sp.]TGQ37841.1 hypothetical protein EN857_14185 [Mesorhizobium sp. M4B.F.Ca.ET.214.01.1.1]TGQ59608.1 hypothetical protein EN854_16915 [Mesorhizobium sp. M4B.F.Ca.ET.211.01.1.1]TGU34673.1 hypothetical protein EN793_16910 [Mesorhizobium sp. M4B.F.Ca.ET.150.01.1.1]RWI63196.1 MAG: hypothetical protein EOR17_29780 [Mesorhizobium sp.]
MSAIARTLGVSRSNVIDRSSKPSKPRGPYRKPEDVAAPLAELHSTIAQRPTYGYRRVTALLNRQRRKDGRPMVNAKRVLRVMQQNGLNLQSIQLCGPPAPTTVSYVREMGSTPQPSRGWIDLLTWHCSTGSPTAY